MHAEAAPVARAVGPPPTGRLRHTAEANRLVGLLDAALQVAEGRAVGDLRLRLPGAVASEGQSEPAWLTSTPSVSSKVVCTAFSIFSLRPSPSFCTKQSVGRLHSP